MEEERRLRKDSSDSITTKYELLNLEERIMSALRISGFSCGPGGDCLGCEAHNGLYYEASNR